MTATARATTLEIRTPEGVAFSFPLAGPVTRMIACTIDFFSVSAVVLVVRIALGSLGVLPKDLLTGFTTVVFFLITFGYAMVLEWFWRGQTVGKRLMKLRVMDAHGLRLLPSQVIVRNLLRAIDVLPAFYLVGGTAALVSRHAQRLGDLAANTVVVRLEEPTLPELQRQAGARYNSLLTYAHLAARLRQRTSPEIAAIALAAVARRDTLDPAARVQLFGDLASHLRGLVEFPDEAVEALSDEQYVRNAVEVFYLRR
jgi:uncharacterized RDD family membrane protein YckC